MSSVPAHLLAFAAVLAAPGCAATFSFAHGQHFLGKYCRACHHGSSAAGGFRLESVAAEASFRSQAPKWTSLIRRVRNHEMPPRGAPAPSLEETEQFSRWAEQALRHEVCAAGPASGPALARRLNRDEYAATLRDLLDIHLDIASALPADGAGGEGFDNAAETLFLSPLLAEKYLEVAKFAIDYAAKEHKSRAKLLIASPGDGRTEDQAARAVLADFLPKAFRRPVTSEEVASYLGLFHSARRLGQPFDGAVFFALRAALVSPAFLFHVEPPNLSPEPRPLDPYALASRLSYFLWGSMPDELLFDVAAAGKLHDPAVLGVLTRRMLRHDRALGFAQRFVEQWLGTRALLTDKAPDAKLFPFYAADEELRSDVRLQPVLFFQEVFARDLPLTDFLDSRHTVGTSNLSKLLGFELAVRKDRKKQPQWVELPAGSDRGGLLGMPAVLAVSSHPYRTSPVLRGAFILDALLGEPPPPPPPNVPPLDQPGQALAGASVRERLERHRADPACGSCHSRIDPLGFALENYDVLGRWRDQEGGKPVDNAGELPGGVRFRGPAELKKVLLERKDAFVRNLAAKMLGFALGRGLTLTDSCTVEPIVEHVRAQDYRAQALIDGIVGSIPFRMQAPSPAASRARKESSVR